MVIPAHLGKLYSKQCIDSGNDQRQSYHECFKRQALDRDLNGYIKRLYYDKIEIVIAGTDEDAVNGFDDIITDPASNVNVIKITLYAWDVSVIIGVEITYRYATTRLAYDNTSL